MYMEEAGFLDVRRWGYKVLFWMGPEKEMLGSRKRLMHVVGNKRGPYWHAIYQLLKGRGYEEEGMGMGMLRGKIGYTLRKEEGMYQVFCTTVGRKPEMLNGDEIYRSEPSWGLELSRRTKILPETGIVEAPGYQQPSHLARSPHMPSSAFFHLRP